MNNDISTLILIVVIALFVGAYLFFPWFFLYKGHKAHCLCRLIKALPTSKTKGVFMGLVEVKGSIESPAALTSFLAESACVWYDYSIEEHWRRTVTETYKDSNGNTRTRTRVEQGWSTVASQTISQDFYLRDDTGDILIRPSGAQIEPKRIFRTTCGKSDPLYYGKGPSTSIANSTGTRRFTEKALPIGASIYIIGTAKERPDIVAPEIAAGKKGTHFIISTKNEEGILKSRALKSWGFPLLGLLLWAGLPFAIYFTENTPGFYNLEIQTCWLLTSLYLLVWILSRIWIVYNCLINLRNRVKQGLSLVEVQFQRRYDLIPQLVNIIKAYMEHEKDTLTKLSELRSIASAFAREEISIRMLEESYPELNSQPLFSQLSQQLKDTEDRIALAREYYNEIANHYNTVIQIYPEKILAFLSVLKPYPLLTLDTAQT